MEGNCKSSLGNEPVFIFLSFVVLLEMQKLFHRSFIMSSAVVVKPTIVINCIVSVFDLEAGELRERRLMGAWPAGHLTKRNKELQWLPP